MIIGETNGVIDHRASPGQANNLRGICILGIKIMRNSIVRRIEVGTRNGLCLDVSGLVMIRQREACIGATNVTNQETTVAQFEPQSLKRSVMLSQLSVASDYGFGK